MKAFFPSARTIRSVTMIGALLIACSSLCQAVETVPEKAHALYLYLRNPENARDGHFATNLREYQRMITASIDEIQGSYQPFMSVLPLGQSGMSAEKYASLTAEVARLEMIKVRAGPEAQTFREYTYNYWGEYVNRRSAFSEMIEQNIGQVLSQFEPTPNALALESRRLSPLVHSIEVKEYLEILSAPHVREFLGTTSSRLFKTEVLGNYSKFRFALFDLLDKVREMEPSLRSRVIQAVVFPSVVERLQSKYYTAKFGTTEPYYSEYMLKLMKAEEKGGFFGKKNYKEVYSKIDAFVEQTTTSSTEQLAAQEFFQKFAADPDFGWLYKFVNQYGKESAAKTKLAYESAFDTVRRTGVVPVISGKSRSVFEFLMDNPASIVDCKRTLAKAN